MRYTGKTFRAWAVSQLLRVPAGFLAGQHGRGAVSRQPPGQRGGPLGRVGVDRQGHRAGWLPCTGRVRVREKTDFFSLTTHHDSGGAT